MCEREREMCVWLLTRSGGGGRKKSLTIRQFLLGNLARRGGHNDHDGGGRVLRFRVPLDVLGRALDHMGDFPFKDPEAARFKGPFLLVRGTRSHYVPDEALAVTGRFFPRFEHVDVDAGHWVISENPEAFRSAVVRFLEPKE